MICWCSSWHDIWQGRIQTINDNARGMPSWLQSNSMIKKILSKHLHLLEVIYPMWQRHYCQMTGRAKLCVNYIFGYVIKNPVFGHASSHSFAWGIFGRTVKRTRAVAISLYRGKFCLIVLNFCALWLIFFLLFHRFWCLYHFHSDYS